MDNIGNCINIVKEIMKNECSIDEFPVTPAIEHINKKAKNENAVNYYFKYLDLQKGSAEEQLSLSFDSIFTVYPKKVLETISTD